MPAQALGEALTEPRAPAHEPGQPGQPAAGLRTVQEACTALLTRQTAGVNLQAATPTALRGAACTPTAPSLPPQDVQQPPAAGEYAEAPVGELSTKGWWQTGRRTQQRSPRRQLPLLPALPNPTRPCPPAAGPQTGGPGAAGAAGPLAPAALPTSANSTLAEATAAYKAGNYAGAMQQCQAVSRQLKVEDCPEPQVAKSTQAWSAAAELLPARADAQLVQLGCSAARLRTRLWCLQQQRYRLAALSGLAPSCR